jgi:hypothetical protein
MMKKVMFVVLSLLVASACFALESGPSNKVGYTKITCGVGYTPFGIAFKTWQVPVGGIPTYGTPGNKPSDIIGDQANCGNIIASDKILRQGGDLAGRYGAGCTWAGSLETTAQMRSSGAYWYQNKTASPRDIVIAGEADVTSLPDSAIVAPNTYKQYSWRDPRVRPREQLQLQANGFTCGNVVTSDKLIQQLGDLCYCSSPSGNWNTSAGALLQVTPGKAYWIQSKHGTAWTYRYDPTSSANLSAPGGDKQISTPANLMKVATPKTVTQAASATN